MSGAPLYPGATLGVLGGGQLGAMFAAAALRLGYRVAVWDPDPDAPAHRAAYRSFTTSFADPATAREFSRSVSAVTLEWENVPAALCEALAETHPVRPSGAVLRVIQDRIEQKQFLQAQGFPVPSFRIVEAPRQLASAVAELGGAAICKTATSGYDGKGQWTIGQASDVAGVEQALDRMVPRGARWIVEETVDFERELSVLVVRGQDGDQRVYPVVENRHEGGILRLSVVPAGISDGLSQQAADLAMRAVRALNGVGVFCVELFHARTGALLINEIAPRPHNSGHYTLDACSVSQFEQQVRALCGLPLGEVRLLSPAAMVNVIGQDLEAVTSREGCHDLLATPGAVLHLYGKRVARPGRKMGHVTFLADRVEQVATRARRFAQSLRA